jgi:hypothetical protein
VKVKSEGATAKGSEYDEDTDGEGASSSKKNNEEEEDLVALNYQDSQRRKMGAAVSTSRSILCFEEASQRSTIIKIFTNFFNTSSSCHATVDAFISCRHHSPLLY